MKKIYLIALLVVTLSSCGEKSSGVSQEEVQQMIEQAKAEAKEEAKAEAKAEAMAEAKAEFEAQAPSPSSSGEYNASSNSSSTTPSSSSPSGLNQKAYKEGYDDGMSLAHVYGGLNYFLGENERQLKSKFIIKCQYGGLGKENVTNKELYAEYKKGFIQGHKDGNSL